MHKLKNKKLFSLLLASMISVASISIKYIYANDELNNTEQEVVAEDIKNININDINNSDNLNLKVKTKGIITKIEENNIYIKDDSGEGIVFLENIELENLKEGDIIDIIGTVKLLEDKNIILVDNIDNINVIISEEKEDTNISEENTSENIDNSDILTETPKEENTEQEINNQPTNKPSDNSSNSISKNEVIKNDSTMIDEVISKNVVGKAVITISSDLTASQWENVKTALEEGSIKVKDIPNNKLRITKVSSEKGDTIWIVNDPRMLDSEDEEVDIVNSKSVVLVNSINYEEYDITQIKWNSIVDDIIDGSAKIKSLNNGDLKIIYTKSSVEDSTVIISKL